MDALVEHDVCYDGSLVEDLRLVLSRAPRGTRDRPDGARLRRILRGRFSGVVVVDAGWALDAGGALCFRSFVEILARATADALELELGAGPLHPEELAQLLKDESKLLFCFFSVHLLSERDLQRLRGIGFTQTDHRVLFCGHNDKIRARSVQDPARAAPQNDAPEVRAVVSGSSSPSSERPELGEPGQHDERGQRDSFFTIQSIVQPEDLRVVFQPIVSLATRRRFALEALLRCRYASAPELFDRAYEEGCVGRLGRMIREVAVPLGSGLPIFLNIHHGELDTPWLVRPDDPIFAHDSDVFLEVSESVPMLHFELCSSVLRELQTGGRIHLAVDDLGAGYSNLKSIFDLEPRVVKLDRNLIAGIQVSRRRQQLVAGVVNLCTDLNATVVAEGIETHDEYSALLDSGVELGQGFLFARPGFPAPSVAWPPPAAP